ncbi:MAG TPA: branched-chain-amino-acid transaminase, partial [Anaerolineales bacterium]|nr:branched-chain-amino-acid transaminase [Anaerolineales bacterium]
MGIESKYIWMDGKLVEFDKATVHILTPAMHYGAALFEGIRAYNTPKGPAIFRLTEHIERLFTSARIFGIVEFPFNVDDLVKAAKDVVRENGFTDCYIRPLMYLRDGMWSLNVTVSNVSVMIAAWEWSNYLGEEALANGIRANISSFTRHHPNVSMTKSKVAGNYVNSILAKTESERLGFQEAIMLDPQGYVAECTGENLFLVKKGR